MDYVYMPEFKDGHCYKTRIYTEGDLYREFNDVETNYAAAEELLNSVSNLEKFKEIYNKFITSDEDSLEYEGFTLQKCSQDAEEKEILIIGDSALMLTYDEFAEILDTFPVYDIEDIIPIEKHTENLRNIYFEKGNSLNPKYTSPTYPMFCEIDGKLNQYIFFMQFTYYNQEDCDFLMKYYNCEDKTVHEFLFMSDCKDYLGEFVCPIELSKVTKEQLTKLYRFFEGMMYKYNENKKEFEYLFEDYKDTLTYYVGERYSEYFYSPKKNTIKFLK